MKIAVNDQIHLSEFRPADKAALVEYLNEKEIYDRTLRVPYPYTEADAEFWFALVEKTTQEQGRTIHWAIRDEQEQLIGGCGFQDIHAAHRAELGFWLAKPEWGRGIMTAVVRRLTAFAFAEFPLVKISAHVFVGNTASARVLEKCGFVQEGLLRKHVLKDGRFLDVAPYALLSETISGLPHFS